ncbi:response regulator [Paludibaculum fermentans]|uniref:Response regulator n=1 Tax=Paludibaculum fermentans TaxID=1473598 RepID=A0A7S7NXM4_PALFE|nr:response regulator [Paludibaculum fermentans]QOY91650.1 response regulator [Paludibaculum fermentans]
MSSPVRVLLADDSPHAQRMGERILREEGYEVVTITEGDTVLVRLADVDPDLVLADVFLPQKSGYEICRYIKSSEKHRHAGVVLIAGLLEPVDEEEARRAGCDAVLKKPFEASVVLETIKPLIDKARFARGLFSDTVPPPPPPEEPAAVVVMPPRPELDPEAIRAAVTIALDRSLPAIVEEITGKILIALGH